jgi:hypothetical protein
VEQVFQQGDSWVCDNANCGAKIIVVAGSKLDYGHGPRCTCGSSMIKPYVAPSVRKLASDEARIVLQKLGLLGKTKS